MDSCERSPQKGRCMTDLEKNTKLKYDKLRELIEYAVAHGFECNGLHEDAEFSMLDSFYRLAVGVSLEVKGRQYSAEELLFNHDFAKIIFGEDEYYYARNGERCGYKRRGWQQHLQEMVLIDHKQSTDIHHRVNYAYENSLLNVTKPLSGEGSPLAVAEAAYKHLAKSAHPDRGGSKEKMLELNQAIEELRKNA